MFEGWHNLAWLTDCSPPKNSVGNRHISICLGVVGTILIIQSSFP